MISRLQLLRYIGQFDSVSQPSGVDLNRLTLIYAENGRGKTTLAAILRSLATGDPIPIQERQRFGAPNAPHVVVNIGSQTAAVFENGAWNRTIPEIVIFDDAFVDDNVCSGLAVAVSHRQKLHELILGAHGVWLNRQLQHYVDRIEEHNRNLRAKTEAIPASVRGRFSVDEFCALQPHPEIEKAIEAAERNLAAVRHQERIRNTPHFAPLNLPEIDVAALERLLEHDLASLNQQAADHVQVHIASIGNGGESWIADGMRRLQGSNTIQSCPFCAQELATSPIIEHYRAYFSAAYKDLKQDTAAAIGEFRQFHAEDSPAAFERAVRVCIERHQFWSQFCEVPEVNLETAEIGRSWRAAREAVLSALQAKQGSPLERMPLSGSMKSMIGEYQSHRNALAALNSRLEQAKLAIDIVKEQASSGNPAAIEADLIRLKACQSRQKQEVAGVCDKYLAEKAAKVETERLRDQTKDALRHHRETIFPSCQTAINEYLRKFNATFRFGEFQATDTRGGPTCTYHVLVNSFPIPITGTPILPGTPSFKTALSSGDRNTLALAFFFASLDNDSDLAQKIVVIDDPITSLDDHRSVTTVQEIRRLLERVSQVVVLSHTKPFLCRIWEHTEQSECAALEFCRDPTGSTLARWDVTQDCITEHDRRHALLREYIDHCTPNNREVARAIRPLLEAFLRVACPRHFPPGTLLGSFRGLCEQRVSTPEQILHPNDTAELRDLVEYANRFHHDTNPAWETETINDTELRGFVGRALEFARR